MTTPFWALLFLILLPIVLAGVSDYLRAREFDSYDNNYPREQTAKLSDLGKRAWAAQQNAWEALIIFTPSVMVAHLTGADVQQSAYAALIFCGARAAHAAFYLLNSATLRSISYMVALGCCCWLFWLAANA